MSDYSKEHYDKEIEKLRKAMEKRKAKLEKKEEIAIIKADRKAKREEENKPIPPDAVPAEEDIPKPKPYVFHKPRLRLNPLIWMNPRVWYKVFLWRRWRKKALKRIIARIQTSNTDYIQLMFSLKPDNTFTWNKGRYICIDQTAKWNITAAMEEYFFHKDISVSLDVNLDAEKLKQYVKDQTLDAEAEGKDSLLEVYHDLDPRYLQHWVEAEAGKVALTANSIGEFFKRMFGIALLTLFCVIIFFMIYGFNSGFFESLGG